MINQHKPKYLRYCILMVASLLVIGWFFTSSMQAWQGEISANPVEEFWDSSIIPPSLVAGNVGYVPHIMLDGKADARFLFMHRWNYLGTPGIYHDHTIGVFYDSKREQWAVFNQDLAPIPEGFAFNRLLPAESDVSFIHRHPSSVPASDESVLSHPTLDANPDAIVQITAVWNPPGSVGVYNDRVAGVGYDASRKRWLIMNDAQKNLTMPTDAAFTVFVAPDNGRGFVHTTTSDNTFDNFTYLNLAALDANPAAVLMVTPRWSYPHTPGSNNNLRRIGVWYDTETKRWAIYNEDHATMPVGATFNVYYAATPSPTPVAVFPPSPSPEPTASATVTPIAGCTPAPAVTGTQFVDGCGAAIMNEQVWVSCYGDGPANALQSQHVVTTDSLGQPTTPLPSPCTHITALRTRHTQPAHSTEHGPAWRLYDASWRTGSGTPIHDATLNTIARPTAGRIVIRQDWPLVLFNIVASLEWQPSPSGTEIDQLRNGLRAASLYLADLTDDYMAIGPLTIYTNGEQWDSADLRIQAANDLRPSAFVGGIVSDTIVYESRLVSPTLLFDPTYKPAAIFLGRAWDGQNAAAGRWDSAAGYRTLIHEWAHYALFLYDEYQDNVGATIYCTYNRLATPVPSATPGAASAMAYHYHASELWHPGQTQDPHPSRKTQVCDETDQAHVHGRSDWETLERWFAIQALDDRFHLPKPGFLPDPDLHTLTATRNVALDFFARLPGDRWMIYLPLTSRSVTTPTPTPAPAPADRLVVNLPHELEFTRTLASQVYLIKDNPVDPLPARVLYQGEVLSPAIRALNQMGQTTLLGLESSDAPGDSLRVDVDRYFSLERSDLNGTRFAHAGLLHLASAPVVSATLDSWLTSLDLVYHIRPSSPDRIVDVEVVLTSTSTISPPIAFLCVPDPTIGCTYAQQPMTVIPGSDSEKSSEQRWQAILSKRAEDRELPLYGVVGIYAPETGTLLRWMRDAGGVGPGHMVGGAPLREGLVMVDYLGLNMISQCNRVMVMPATDVAALTSALPFTRTTLAAQPLDIDILLGPNCDNHQAFTDATIPNQITPLRLTLFYNQESIERMGIDENELTIIHFTRSVGGWKELFPVQRNRDLNWVATTLGVGETDGIFAVVWKE